MNNPYLKNNFAVIFIVFFTAIEVTPQASFKDENIGKCMICKEEQVCTVLGPCSHKIGKHCYDQLQKSSFTCPLCNEKIKETTNIDYYKKCAICLNEEITVELNPCKHSFGNNCSNRLRKNKFLCPICRKPIENFKGIASTSEIIQEINIDNNNNTNNVNNESIMIQPEYYTIMNDLGRRSSEGNLSNSELMLYYGYLMPCQRADQVILEEFYQIRLRDYPSNLTCLRLYLEFSESLDITMQTDNLVRKFFWIIDLHENEVEMLRNFYIRSNLNPDEEMARRNEFSNMISDLELNSFQISDTYSITPIDINFFFNNTHFFM